MVRKGARKTKRGGFFNLFSRTNKAKTEKKKKNKRVKSSIETKELALFNNEQDCSMELRKPKNKGAKCRLIGYASYALEKEIPVYTQI